MLLLIIVLLLIPLLMAYLNSYALEIIVEINKPEWFSFGVFCSREHLSKEIIIDEVEYGMLFISLVFNFYKLNKEN